jgi:hypothetical protein
LVKEFDASSSAVARVVSIVIFLSHPPASGPSDSLMPVSAKGFSSTPLPL